MTLQHQISYNFLPIVNEKNDMNKGKSRITEIVVMEEKCYVNPLHL